MNKFRFTIKLLVIAAFTLAFASLAQAQATRTWVSGVGDDANPCSRTAPCKTFAGAISKTAPSGEINVLDPGGFGAVTITKAITISSEGFEAGVLVSGTNGIVIAAGVNDVIILRGLDIEGLGTGLVGVKILNNAKTVIVENCNVHNFKGSGGTGIQDNRTQASPVPMLFVNNCNVRDNITGIGALGSSANLERVIIENTKVQANTGVGVDAQAGSVVSIKQSNITGNLSDGVKVSGNAQAVVIGTIFTNNQGIAVNNVGGTLTISDTTIINNVTSHAGTITTFGTNNCRQNANNVGTNCALGAPVGQT